MVETKCQETLDNDPVSLTTIHGEQSLILGLPIAAMGVFYMILAAGVVSSPESSWKMPRWAGGCAGLSFALAGASMLANGVAGIRRKTSVAAAKLSRPTEPWAWDHPWNPRGTSDRGNGRLLRVVWGMFFLSIFLVPFNCWAWFRRSTALVVKLIVGFFDSALAGLATYGFYLVARRLKFGPSRLRFDRFPLALGERAELHLFPGRGLTGARTLKARLRCIEERFETRGTGRGRKDLVIPYQLWAETLEPPIPSRVEVSGLPLRFSLPEASAEGATLSTRISERPATYWKLEVSASVPGVDYAASFLVPVYERA